MKTKLTKNNYKNSEYFFSLTCKYNSLVPSFLKAFKKDISITFPLSLYCYKSVITPLITYLITSLPSLNFYSAIATRKSDKEN